VRRPTDHRFYWVDILCPDQAAGLTFYAHTLGWTFTPVEGSKYQLARAGDTPVAGLLPLGEGGEAHWLGQLVTDDVVQLCRRLAFLQGKVLLPPEETPGFGTTALVADPAGAVFQPFTPAGTEVSPPGEPQPGAIHFHTLIAPRADLGARVYRSLFEWKAGTTLTTELGAWTPLTSGLRRHAALFEPTEPTVGAQWAHHVLVPSLEPVIERALAQGATLLHPPFDLPRVARLALLADPWGAAFGLREQA
jgi:predicted enzyme related to lactoylglutathione lyase